VAADPKQVLASLNKPSYVLKIIPHVDGTARICRVRRLSTRECRVEVGLEWADLPRPEAPCARSRSRLAVREIISAVHIVVDLTLGLGKVICDYLEA
jgi:acetoacetate decarboxylase